MLIGPCIIVIVEEWKTNLMSRTILFHFLCAQHVSDINISIIRSLRLWCWITTSVVFFYEDGWFSVSFSSACNTGTTQNQPHQISNTQRTEVCKSQIHITKYINNSLNTKQPMKHTTQKRTQWSQRIIDSGQYQLKYSYQLQQSDKAHHTKHKPLYTVNLH